MSRIPCPLYIYILNAATASYLCVLEWAGPYPSANHTSPKVTFAQLDFDQFATVTPY